MKRIIIFSTIAATAAVAGAQEMGRVLSVTPVVQSVAIPRQVCGTESVYNGNRTSGAGAVLGAIAGGAAGNAVGKGTGRAAATVIGVLGGAALGNHIEGGRPQYQDVQRCTTDTYYENRTVGYDVVYEYAGQQYTTRTQNDPGRWIALSVRPTGQSYAPPPPVSYAPPPVIYNQSGMLAPPVVLSAPPVTVIEYGYDSGRPYYPHRPPHNPYWR
ncbi:glycine zipper 2TM domain-containing protein [Verminephrobacter aporrectodeae subsp. tuberculatae]|uniref:glycine zipper 2TM domain-containing protein n=6 Tax=Verminephrobacter aporrectodeae TaxID=1110389 RepID=UPI002237EEFC|nr:glycine zipper 2TM domain-containing protein [Verminephrobacter aporrectodeae]MCW5220488.1 glycine zipper 2TM domain-containing protein [Verminephrobacter aporrectodeae subsp. tuberculatae]MCW5255554.1 glycine zipper 2TM domain-containing protein [Verminephrobacter aporrectodeae subsp. tuberculatae]MCW5289784.1 glycine zipper 2TM domain-containing protein [Verminephrobacter aporrectodeae subsp. tuberculatae]